MSTADNHNTGLVFEKYDPHNPIHIEGARQIAEWQEKDKQSPNYQQMFDLGPNHLAEHVFGLICFDTNEDGQYLTAVGYNAATFQLDETAVETGAMIVNQSYRGRGVAKRIKQELLDRLATELSGQKLVTFANANSEHLNRECGFRDAQREEIPDSALDLCKQCINYQKVVTEAGRICCDTVLIKEL